MNIRYLRKPDSLNILQVQYSDDGAWHDVPVVMEEKRRAREWDAYISPRGNLELAINGLIGGKWQQIKVKEILEGEP